jgi:hypothetical protein
MNTTDATDSTKDTGPEPITVTIAPQPLRWARYAIGDDGEFTERGATRTRPGELARIRLSGPPGAYVPVTYDSATARSTAARLLGYAYHVDSQPLPAYLITTLLAPDTRTATGTTWNLGDGLVLRYITPWSSSLTADHPDWTLTAELARRWARALLALATELDHAYATATQAILAQRTTRTPTENIRAWLDRITPELTADQEQFANQLRAVLSDEDSTTGDEVLFTALELAHPELTTSLADLRLLSCDTITHDDAATVIGQLADLYALPMYLWTATSWFIRNELGGQPLTEQEWRRVGRSAEMTTFAPMIEMEQINSGVALNITLALHQAGVLCRDCGARISGEVAVTLGRCDNCRPADRAKAIDQALAAGCPGGSSGGHMDHVQSVASETCLHCGLPMPEPTRPPQPPRPQI